MTSASEPTPSATPDPKALSAEKLRRLPSSATDDFYRFCTHGDEKALRRLLVEVLTDHLPDKRSVPTWLDETRLIDDLGFDSLAIAELIFYFEDLFQISISNDEILQVQTLGDLHIFVLKKAKAVAA